ncbi:UNVERIFIED_CONTAM: hypothetical protein K2H54_014244 [Gekko kuhli]
MLQGLFRETPTALHLVGLFSHLAYWTQREEAEVHMRAASLSCSLLRFVRQLPSFQNAPEPLFGSVVAQLAVSLLDPVPEIPERAREAASHLYALLLQQPGDHGQLRPGADANSGLGPEGDQQPRPLPASVGRRPRILHRGVGYMAALIRRCCFSPQHRAYWTQREEAEVRMRAASLSCSLLRFVRQLPSFRALQASEAMLQGLFRETPTALHLVGLLSNAPEPLFGSVVAQLAVSLLDPVPEIPERAREAASHLYALLLQQPMPVKSLRASREEESSSPVGNAPELLEGGQLPVKSLRRASQEEAFLKACWEMVMCLAQKWVKVGGLLLLFSLLGQAYGLLEEEKEEEGLKSSVSGFLLDLWEGWGVPEEMRGIL